MVTLYHGTTKDIESQLVPQESETIDGTVGAYVFATTHRPTALIHALWTKDMVAFVGVEDQKFLIIENHTNFQETARGTLFHLHNASSFKHVFLNGKPTGEYISSTPVDIEGAEKESISAKQHLPEIIHAGIDIYFVKDLDRQAWQTETSSGDRMHNIQEMRQYLDTLVGSGALVHANTLYRISNMRDINR